MHHRLHLVILSMSIQCAVRLFGYSINVNSVCSEALWLFYQCQFSVQWSCLVILSMSIKCAVRLFGYSINVNSVCSEAVWLSTYVLTQVVMLSSLSDELILLLSFKVNVTDASCFSGFPISSQTINVSSSSTGRHFTSPSWQQDKYSVEDHILIQHKGNNLPPTPPNHHHHPQPPPPHAHTLVVACMDRNTDTDRLTHTCPLWSCMPAHTCIQITTHTHT